MFFDNLTGLLRVLVIGPLAYIWLVAVLRLTGKRTLAQLNAFDFIVTVALGSTLATVILSGDVAWAEGALALALLALLQLLVAWIAVRSARFRQVVTSEPSLLVVDGVVQTEALKQARISEHSLQQSVRSAGLGGLELVGAVVVETNGKLSVISADQMGSGSALRGLSQTGPRADRSPG